MHGKKPSSTIQTYLQLELKKVVLPSKKIKKTADLYVDECFLSYGQYYREAQSCIINCI